MKLSEMRTLLSSRSIQLTKSLGQNFLHDQNQLRKIAHLAELRPGDQVLEIGPGLGPLTEELLAAGARVWAVEKDHRLCAVLRERFADRAGFELLHADALDLLKREKRDWTAWKLVSNLPYSVASPILVELALGEHPPERMVATLQLEVVERIVAPTGTKHYGQLTLFLQSRFEPQAQFKIPSSCFFPPPEVDSGCILLRRRSADLLAPELRPAFLKIVKRAFSERRKIAMKLLKQDWPENTLTTAFEELALDFRARAETLSLAQFVGLTERLAGGGRRVD